MIKIPERLRRASHQYWGQGSGGAVAHTSPVKYRLMTANKFRSMALEISGAVESSHMNHPDFRIGGKIFATLGYPNDEHGMVKLTPEQQRKYLKKAPGVFHPCAGAWGKGG